MSEEIFDSRAAEIIMNVESYFAKEKKATTELLHNLTRLLKYASSSNQDMVTCKQIVAEMYIELRDKTKVMKRIMNATGVAKRTVTRLRAEKKLARRTGRDIETPIKRTRGKKIYLNVFGLSILKNFINSYTVQNKIPTLRGLMTFAKEELNFKGSKTTLRRILKNQLGYQLSEYIKANAKKDQS